MTPVYAWIVKEGEVTELLSETSLPTLKSICPSGNEVIISLFYGMGLA
jgi:hypothetical protein